MLHILGRQVGVFDVEALLRPSSLLTFPVHWTSWRWNLSCNTENLMVYNELVRVYLDLIGEKHMIGAIGNPST